MKLIMGDADKIRLESDLLKHIDKENVIEDTWKYCNDRNISHPMIIGVVKSLLVDAFVIANDVSTSFYTLTEEAESFIQNGSPEVRMFECIPNGDGGISRTDIIAKLGEDVVKVAQGACMKNKWIKLDKLSGMFSRMVCNRVYPVNTYSKIDL